MSLWRSGLFWLRFACWCSNNRSSLRSKHYRMPFYLTSVSCWYWLYQQVFYLLSDSREILDISQHYHRWGMKAHLQNNNLGFFFLGFTICSVSDSGQTRSLRERYLSIILLFFSRTLSIATGTLHQDFLLTGDDHVQPCFRSRPCFKTEEHSTTGTLLVSPCTKTSQCWVVLWNTFSDHSLNFFMETGDSIEEKQTYTTSGSSSVLVMHRPDIRREPEKVRGNEKLGRYLAKKTNKSIHSFTLQVCQS